MNFVKVACDIRIKSVKMHFSVSHGLEIQKNYKSGQIFNKIGI